jgi:hypothetical protein
MGWVEHAKFFDVFSLWNEWFTEKMTRRGLDKVLTAEAVEKDSLSVHGAFRSSKRAL